MLEQMLTTRTNLRNSSWPQTRSRYRPQMGMVHIPMMNWENGGQDAFGRESGKPKPRGANMPR
jgi:hypothetical protein